MMNQSPHILDAFIQIGGMPSRVVGHVETRLHHIEVEDLAEAMLTYENGATGYLYCSTNEAGPGQMIEIFGDRGKLVFRNGELKLYRFDQPVAEFTRTNKAMWGGPTCVEKTVRLKKRAGGHRGILKNFTRHILTGEPLVSPGPDGLRSLELANAIWLSSHLGKPVSLPISRRAYDAFLAEKRKKSSFVKEKKGSKRETDPRLGK